ncbi:hypothetical protein BDV26DRAFT_256125 [Aspergillus bertholletiae]|uniref:DUF924-domain-containing protein n=1 Tax=Aspergillus bertholletiae TaxID=1226010 RepID=A0A5N7BH55_9EURO|nr:hypothetical protein BDV26DRAFT_256125 [Aspergillus bertholletiae]
MMGDCDKVQTLKAELTPTLFHMIRVFWFRHINDAQVIVVPGREDAVKWFSRDESFDQSCRIQFGPVLSLIRSTDIDGAGLLDAATLDTPLDWMALIILLDQIPRNCYRGDEARVAYSLFDPLALYIALRAIETGIPTHSDVRYRHAYRFWFYMPLVHSEQLDMQERLNQEYDRMFSDSRHLVHTVPSGSDDQVLYCRDVLTRRNSVYNEWEQILQSIAADYARQIRRFSRYPRRNQALKRESTEEERQYLENPFSAWT